jgi:hypothetical protein
MKYLKHALAIWGSPGSSSSGRRGQSPRCASTTTITIASSTGLASAGRAARAMARDGEHNRREQAVQDGRAAATRRSGRAAYGREGRGWRRPPCWRRPAASGRHGGCARSGRMHAAVVKGNAAVFFLRNHVVLKVKRRRPVGPDRWAGSRTSRLDRTRLDGRSCANIIIKKHCTAFCK